jgi:hypothetical protein
MTAMGTIADHNSTIARLYMLPYPKNMAAKTKQLSSLDEIKLLLKAKKISIKRPRVKNGEFIIEAFMKNSKKGRKPHHHFSSHDVGTNLDYPGKEWVAFSKQSIEKFDGIVLCTTRNFEAPNRSDASGPLDCSLSHSLRSKGGPPQQGTCLTKRRRSGRLLM